MKRSFNQRLKKLILLLILGFLILFIFRLIHGYTKPIHQNTNQVQFLEELSNVRNMRWFNKSGHKKSLNLCQL